MVNGSPKKVVIHARDPDGWDDDDGCANRIETIQKIFWGAGLAPPRFVSAQDWYIEPWIQDRSFGGLELWVGRKFPKTKQRLDARRAAKLLARIHQIPIDWFAPFKAKIIQQLPSLIKAHAGSHIWVYAIRLWWYGQYQKFHPF